MGLVGFALKSADPLMNFLRYHTGRIRAPVLTGQDLKVVEKRSLTKKPRESNQNRITPKSRPAEPAKRTRLLIVARYLARESGLSFLAVLAVLLVVFTTQQFIRFLGLAIDGRIAYDMVTAMLALQLPSMLNLLLPLAMFLGVLLAAGRLYVDSEMVVLRACGYSEWQFLRWLALPALVLAGVAGGNAFMLAPWADAQQVALTEAFAARGDTAQLSSGRFQLIAGGKRVIYTEVVDADKKMHKVFIADLPPQDSLAPMNVVAAERGQIITDTEGDEYLELLDGNRVEGRPGRRDFTVSDYASYRTLLQAKTRTPKARKLRSYTTAELLAEAPSAAGRAELQWRLAIPLSTLVFVALALPLARTNPRQGRYAGVLPAIGLYLLYMLLLMTARNAMGDGKFPLALGLWPIHGAALVTALLLLVRGSGWPGGIRRPAREGSAR